MIAKVQRERDEKYSEWVRKLPCIVCLSLDPDGSHFNGETTVGHHWQERGHGGKGTKCSDRRRVPLCYTHHAEVHLGRQTFAAKYGIDAEVLITKLNELWEAINDT